MKQTLRLSPTRAAFILLLVLLLCVEHRAQSVTDTVAPPPPSPAPYRAGERLSYQVSFSNFESAAHIELFVAGHWSMVSREGIELRGHVETLGVVSAALYSVNNDYVSYVDPATGLPFRTQQVLREGSRAPLDAARDLNQPIGVNALPARETAGGFPGTYDFISAIYRLRSLALAQGASYRLNVQGTNETYDAELRVTGRELLKTNIGSFNAIVGQIAVRQNPSANSYGVRLYFSDDERHIPLLMTARHPSGEIRVEIASAEFVQESAPATPDAPATNVQPPAKANGTPLVAPPATTPRASPGVARNVPPVSAATDGAEADATLAGLPFSVGEQLNYRFFLGNAPQPAGTASLQVRARARYFNRDGLLLTAAMNTVGAGQTLFPVNDFIGSYVDASSLLPFRTELRIQEGRHRLNALISVDQERGSASFTDGTRLEIPIVTHDLLSVFYAIRSFDLTPPKRNAVSLLINKRPRTLFISAQRRETIEINGQQIAATQLSLSTDDPQGDRLQLRIWISADRRKLPLRLVAVTPLGPVRAELAILPVSQQ